MSGVMLSMKALKGLGVLEQLDFCLKLQIMKDFRTFLEELKINKKFEKIEANSWLYVVVHAREACAGAYLFTFYWQILKRGHPCCVMNQQPLSVFCFSTSVYPHFCIPVSRFFFSLCVRHKPTCDCHNTSNKIVQ